MINVRPGGINKFIREDLSFVCLFNDMKKWIPNGNLVKFIIFCFRRYLKISSLFSFIFSPSSERQMSVPDSSSRQTKKKGNWSFYLFIFRILLPRITPSGYFRWNENPESLPQDDIFLSRNRFGRFITVAPIKFIFSTSVILNKHNRQLEFYCMHYRKECMEWERGSWPKFDGKRKPI